LPYDRKTVPKIATVAIVQAELLPTLAEGLERTSTLAQEAAAAGAKLVVFPETWLPGYPVWLDVCRDAALWDHEPTKTVFRRLAAESVDVRGTSGSAIARIASELHIVLVVGVTEQVASGPGRGTLYNTLLTYGPDGSLLNHHRKLVPTYTERLVWGQGDASGLRAVDTSVGRIGGLICWEHWMPLSRQALHEAGEDIHCAVWPTVKEVHQLASRHYAFEGRCYVLAAGALMRASALPPELEAHPERVKDPDQWVLNGGSAIVAPDGSYVVPARFDAPAILHAQLDLDRVRQEAMTLDVAGHYHRPDCFEFHVNRDARLTA
jgi:nitrilase